MTVKIVPDTVYAPVPAPTNDYQFLTNYYCNYGWVAGTAQELSVTLGSTTTPSSAPPITQVSQISSRNVATTTTTTATVSPRKTEPAGYIIMGVGALLGLLAAALIVVAIIKKKF